MSSSQRNEMNIKSCKDYKYESETRINAKFEVNNCDYDARYMNFTGGLENRNWETGTSMVEYITLWKDDRKEEIRIIKITKDDLSTEFDVRLKLNDPNSNLEEFVSSWMKDVLKIDIFTEKDNYDDLMTLQVIFDFVMLNIF